MLTPKQKHHDRSLKDDQRGFHVIGAMVILVVLGLIGYAGWYVWENNKKFEKPVTADAGTSDTTAPAAPSSTSSAPSKATTQPVEKTTYSNDEYGFSFSYPKTWVFSQDLKDSGRGSNEGDVTVVSPNKTVVTFNLNLGGKGGDCWDDQADARTARTCSTVTTLNVRQLPHKDGYRSVYLWQAKEKTADRDGGSIRYVVGLSADNSGAPKVGSELTPFLAIILNAKKGYVNIHAGGKDDATNSSESFLSSTEANETTSILETVSLIQ